MTSHLKDNEHLVNSLHAASEDAPPLKAVRDYLYNKELQRLQMENEQLRRELEEANNRIQELEQSRHSFACIIPDSSYDSDNFSVEVQSVSSSVTTVQTGNNQQRDDQKHPCGDDEINRSVTPLASGSRRRQDPVAHLSPSFRFVQEMRFLSRSSDSNSCTSATSSQSVCSIGSSQDGVSDRNAIQNRNKVSTYAMRYLLRTNSTESSDSDPSWSDHRRVEV